MSTVVVEFTTDCYLRSGWCTAGQMMLCGTAESEAIVRMGHGRVVALDDLVERVYRGARHEARAAVDMLREIHDTADAEYRQHLDAWIKGGAW